MITLITYDIADPARLRNLHKVLSDYGVNTQKSVFECEIDASALGEIVKYISMNLDKEKDSVRVYKICSRCSRKVEVSGFGVRLDCLSYEVI